MASLAAMLKDSGYEVSGSDAGVYPPMSDFLIQKQIRVIQGYDAGNLQPEPDLVVVGNALSRGNPEIEHVLNFRLPFVSFPEALKHFYLRRKISTVITGTHGKTTTTSMIAWGLRFAGLHPNFLIGGIAENFQSSYGLEGGSHFVVEGDEYDSAFFDKGPKFLHYLPYYAVLANIEYDHADIYPNMEAVKLQFRRFVNLIPQHGYLAVGADSPAALEISQYSLCKKETFSTSTDSDWSAGNIELKNDRFCFNVLYRKKMFRRLHMRIFGNYNIRNALAATAILNQLGVSEDDIRESLESFDGVRRRMQLRCRINGIRIYEDFAHHPTAVREILQAVRDVIQPERVWAIYEPRSATSRRSVFQKEIAEALGLADCVAIPKLFRPEKVPEGERLDKERLIADLQSRGALPGIWRLWKI